MKKTLLIFACCLLTGSGMLRAQSVQLSGLVTENQHPLAGVSVTLKGSTTGTITDAEGRYTITVPKDATLVFSFIGMKSQEITVHNRTVINVSMEVEAEQLDEVIVIAYGTASKRAFTGAATTLRSEEISKRQVSNVTNMLAGQVAGLQTTSSSGQPGTSSAIRIRGIGSFSASSSPLFVVDGVPYEGGLENINPNDIESVNVLKDATSSSLYGARGANGVIIITTKSGKAREAIVTADVKVGVNSRALLDYKVIKDPATFYETHYRSLYNYQIRRQGETPASADAFANANLIPQGTYGLAYNVYDIPAGQPMIVNGKLNSAATLGRMITGKDGQQYWLQPDDWAKEAYLHTLRQDYNVTISGSSEKAGHYFSTGFLSDKGFVVGSDFSRFTSRMKSDYQVKKWLKVGASAGYAHTNSNFVNADGNSSANVFFSVRAFGPIYPVYVRDANRQPVIDEHGNVMYDWGDSVYGARPVLAKANPIARNHLDTDGNNVNILNANSFAEITFLHDFAFRVSAGADWADDRRTQFTNRYYGQYASSNGIIDKYHSRSFAVNFQQLLTWKRHFGEHRFDAMLGHEYYNRKYFYLYGGKSNVYGDDKLEIASGISNPDADSYRTEYNTEGFFGRVQYDYNNRYFASASYRLDGTSRFRPGARWGNFWSIGGAWLLSEEGFFDVPKVDLLKIKASYGSQGNDNIGDYLYEDLYRITTTPGGIGLIASGLGNPNITWETNHNFNAGVEFQCFDKRITGNVEYFIRRSSNLLFAIPLPPSLGYTSIGENAGTMRNNGFEIDVTGALLKNEHILWTLSLNATHFVNVITALPPTRKDGFETGNYRIEEGKSRYDWYMPQYAGVNSDGLSTWYRDVKDANGAVTGREVTTSYSTATKYFSGSAIPDLYGGISTSVEAYGVDFSIALAYQLGGRSYDAGYASLMYVPASSSKGYAWHQDILNAWSPNNTSSNIPRLSFSDPSVTSTSDRFLTSASFLSVQNITLGYTLPKAWTSKLYLSSLRLFAVADNVLLFSKRQGFDPRQNFDGSSSAQIYAPVRTISGGVAIKF